MADGQGAQIAGLLQNRYRPLERLHRRIFLTQSHLSRRHLRKTYAHSGSIALQGVQPESPDSIVQRLQVLAPDVINFRGHSVAYGQQIGVIRLLANAYGLQDVFLALIQLLGRQADAGKRIEGTAYAALLTFLSAKFQAPAQMPDRLLIIRPSEIEKAHKMLAVALHQRISPASSQW